MVNIYRVLSYEISRTLRRKGFLFATFGLPVLLFVGSFIWQAVTPSPEEMLESIQEITVQFDGLTNVAIVDLTGEFSGVEADSLTLYPDEAAALAALESGDVDAVYVLPTDYAETGMAREIIPRMAMDDITSGPLVALALAALRSEADNTLVQRLQSPSNVTQIDLNSVDADGNPIANELSPSMREDANFTIVYIFAMLFIMTAFTSSGYLMQSVIEEKENRLIEVLITTVRPSQLLAGKVLAGGLMALFQIAVWAVMGALLMNTQGQFLSTMIPILGALVIPQGQLPIIAVYFLLGFFLFAAVFGMIGALSNSSQEGPQLTVLFVLPAMIPLYLAPGIIADPNGGLAVALSLFPLTAPIGMIARLVLVDVPLVHVILSVGLLALTTIGLYWLAGRMFRVQILLSGKLPRLRDLPSLVFSRS